MKLNYIKVKNLKISSELLKFVNEELLKDTNITPEKFWDGFDKTVHKLAPKNKYTKILDSKNVCEYIKE